MKTNSYLQKSVLCLTAVLSLVLAETQWAGDTGGSTASEPNRPSIQSIQVEQSQVVVSVAVPEGVRKVTLESRPRLGTGAWVPKAVQRTDGKAATLTFRIQLSQQTEMLRVRGDEAEALPASFYATGKTNFNGQTSTSAPSTAGPVYSAGPEGNTDATRDSGAGRAVVESDIWKIDGTRLYFFNQYRGLQVVDLANPDAPVLLGELDLPAAGEQMYLLDERHVLLLARAGCGWTATDGSQAVVVDVSQAAPKIVAASTVQGSVMESRLVGTVLYVASQTYRKTVLPPKPGGTETLEQWEWGTVVTSIDLANPEAPVERGTLWFAGYGNVVYATDQRLFVAIPITDNWWRSRIQVIDISLPDGTMKPLGAVQSAGRVADKFKMNWDDGVFTVISEVWDWQTGGLRESVLENFSLPADSAPVLLGSIRLAKGEGLYATRFDGKRAYIVTYLRVDPLWIVDLSDPANPKISGELKVPGWSHYIHPWGDRLVTIGIDDTNSWRVAVSLFDVKEAAAPALLGKVVLGEGYTYSEANYDEKAFTVLPEGGLILVPYQGWSTNGYASRVQLIDLGKQAIAARGVIDHEMQPRRATVYQNRILSISGQELLSVDATDRDKPKVTSSVELSWSVKQVIAVGDYLLELSDGYGWLSTQPAVRVVRANAPDTLLGRVELAEGWSIAGVTQQGGKLYLMQTTGSGGYYYPMEDTKGGGEPVAPSPNLRLSSYDTSQLPALKLLGTTDLVVTNLGWISSLKPMWVRPNLLVWTASQSWGPWYRYAMDIAAPIGRWGGWWGGGNSGQLLAFDVADDASPKLLSTTTLGEEGKYSYFSQLFESEGMVYGASQASEFVPVTTSPGPGSADGTTKPSDPVITGYWVTKWLLSVVDYSDPVNPTVRKPVQIPGNLVGLGAKGALLFTVGPHYDAQGQTDWTSYLDVCSYDGVEVSLVNSSKLPSNSQLVTIRDQVAFVANPDTGTGVSEIQAWTLNPTGAWMVLSRVKLDGWVSNLQFIRDLLVASVGQQVIVMDASDPSNLKTVGKGEPQGCVWPDPTNADYAPGSGLWIPLQDYGVFNVAISGGL